MLNLCENILEQVWVEKVELNVFIEICIQSKQCFKMYLLLHEEGFVKMKQKFNVVCSKK